MTYLVSLSEADFELLCEALTLAKLHVEWIPALAERYAQMQTDLLALKARQDDDAPTGGRTE